MKTKQKKPVFSIILYVAAAVVAVLGTALLVSNIMLYSNNVTQYVAQGYSVETVTAQLLPSQLIPGILEPVSLYYGMAILLAAAGVINGKITKCLAALTEKTVEAEEMAEVEEVSEADAMEDTAEAEKKLEVIEDEETIDECSSAVEDNK